MKKGFNAHYNFEIWWREILIIQSAGNAKTDVS